MDPTITNKILLTNYSCIIDKWVKQEPRYHITLLKQTYFPASFYRIHKRTKKNRTSRKVVVNVSTVHTTSGIKYQGIFKDFFKAKLQFLRTKIYSANQHSLPPLRSPYWLKHVMESFMIFNSSAIVDHIILYYFPQQDFAKWLGMTCNCIWGTEIALEKKKHK